VTRNLIANLEREYDKVVRLCTDTRLAGLMSWSAIEDRLRQFDARQRWQGGADILEAAANSYHQDMWKAQGGIRTVQKQNRLYRSYQTRLTRGAWTVVRSVGGSLHER
jgi:hypothetical protein